MDTSLKGTVSAGSASTQSTAPANAATAAAASAVPPSPPTTPHSMAAGAAAVALPSIEIGALLGAGFASRVSGEGSEGGGSSAAQVGVCACE